MRRALFVIAGILLLMPAATFAQTRQTSSSDSQFSIRGFGDAGITLFTATKSFDAIFGKSSGPTFGGGVEFGFARHLFVSVGASRFHRSGHRVFVFQNQVFTLNEAAIVTITPLEFTAGYRFGGGGLIPYVGGGAGWLKYSETSPHSVAGDDAKISHASYHILGGAEVPMARWLAIAAEAQWSSVPNSFGTASTSVGAVYNEHDLGGATFRVKFVVGR